MLGHFKVKGLIFWNSGSHLAQPWLLSTELYSQLVCGSPKSTDAHTHWFPRCKHQHAIPESGIELLGTISVHSCASQTENLLDPEESCATQGG